MLYDKLKNYSDSGIYPFHMPGHKRTDITKEGLIPYELDLTEIYDFDNLHSPQSVIKEIQLKAEKLYSVKNALLLVNGATGGILSAIRTVTSIGDSVLIARNCHKSVYNAIELFGLDVEYILPETEKNFDIFSSVSPKAIENALSNNKKISAVIITSPTYEGVVSDIKSIAEICHKYNSTLIVDEAHGAHFPFSDIFPCEAVNQGADISIVSLHKSLPSLTQTALLLSNNNELAEKTAENLSVFETSSPSYILMASADKCLDFIYKNPSAFKTYEKLLSKFLDNCNDLKHLKIVKSNNISENVFDFDKSKIVISTSNSNLNGIALADIFRNKFKIETEMAYTNYVIAMTSVCDTEYGYNLLNNALHIIDNNCGKSNITTFNNHHTIPNKVFNPSERYKYKPEKVSLTNAIGKVSLEYVWAYPPGIPVIVPGEAISIEAIAQIEYMLDNKISVFSTHKNLPYYITVTEF